MEYLLELRLGMISLCHNILIIKENIDKLDFIKYFN